MSKYIMAILLILTISNGICSDNLVVWTSGENVKNAIQNVAKKFEKDFETKVEIKVLSKDLTNQFKTAALAGKGPDIFSWAHDVVGELAASGLIEPINMPQKLKKAFFPVALDAFKYKGKTYGYPYDMEAVALIYNKKLLPHPPQSMEEILTISKKIRAKDSKKFGLLYGISNFFFSFPILSAQGGYVFKTTKDQTLVNDIGLANSGAIKGAKLLRRLVTDKIIPSSTDRSIAFNKMKKGELAMTIDGPWALADLKKSGIDFGVTPIPTINGKKPRPFVGVHGFIIRRSSKKKDLAREFIENYLVTKEGILNLYKMDPRGPSRSDALKELANDVHLQNFLESAKNGIPMPNVPQMGAVWNSMGAALNLIVNGKKSAKAALTSAVKQIQSNIAK